jgi:hypothetical protein
MCARVHVRVRVHVCFRVHVCTRGEALYVPLRALALRGLVSGIISESGGIVSTSARPCTASKQSKQGGNSFPSTE